MINATNQLLLITDLDNTLVGDDLATKKLNQYLCTYRQNHVLVYATGRSYASAQQLRQERQLLNPDYWVTGVGTEIYSQATLDLNWANKIDTGWERDAIAAFVHKHFPELKPQIAAEQNRWKLSFHLNETNNSISTLQIDKLANDLQQMKLNAQVVFSSNVDVDILPINANKGNAIKYVQTELGIANHRTLVCGDSGNDISMFQQQTFGVIVSNAQSELIEWCKTNADECHYFANNSYASGILEALQKFDFLLQ